MIEETRITRAIVKTAVDELLDNLEIDVGIAGAGPAGLTCAYYCARGGLKVAIFERRLNFGGGMPGGGMLFPRVAVQQTALPIIKEAQVKIRQFEPGLYTADSVEMISKLATTAINAGTRIYPAIFVEDVLIRENNRICGLVLNWSAVKIAGLHVDPLAVKVKYAVDATGHDAEVARVLERKNTNTTFKTPTGKVMGEKSMWAEEGERLIVDYTNEAHPGLYLAGMSVCAVYGLPRMGAIFGGMLLSGKKAAELILEKLDRQPLPQGQVSSDCIPNRDLTREAASKQPKA